MADVDDALVLVGYAATMEQNAPLLAESEIAPPTRVTAFETTIFEVGGDPGYLRPSILPRKGKSPRARDERVALLMLSLAERPRRRSASGTRQVAGPRWPR